jgi:hypothetical protein
MIRASRRPPMRGEDSALSTLTVRISWAESGPGKTRAAVRAVVSRRRGRDPIVHSIFRKSKREGLKVVALRLL